MTIDNITQSKINKYINGIDAIYWINLERSTERRDKMTQMLSYFPVTNIRINANDGKNDMEDIYNMFQINDTNYSRTKIEYACLLSHLNTIKIFSE